MFTPGSILYIQNYQFENGARSKDKFLIVLAQIGNKSILASLPSSQEYVPAALIKDGCIEDIPSRIHCYHFLAGKSICTNGFSFPKNTFIYFTQNIFETEIERLTTLYPGNQLAAKGVLTDSNYQDVLKCICKSPFISKKIKNILYQHLL